MSLDVPSDAAKSLPFFVVGSRDRSASDQSFETDWTVSKISEELYLVSSLKEAITEKKPFLVGCPSAKQLFEIFSSFIKNCFTGMVSLHTSHAHKQIYFEKGFFSFARSSLIDDRLGEVLYQNNLISLDQLVLSAAQVNNQKRFGQVLIEGKIFSQSRLWLGLVQQIQSIISSIFISDILEFKAYEGEQHYMGVCFADDMQMLEHFYSESFLFRNFYARFAIDAKITLTTKAKDVLTAGDEAASFRGDFLRLIGEEGVLLNELLIQSKLSSENTKLFLMRFVKEGFCHIDSGIRKSSTAFPVSCESAYRAYETCCREVFAFCLAKNILFPLSDLLALIQNIYSLPFPVTLKEDGSLTEISADDFKELIPLFPSLAVIFNRVMRSMELFLEGFLKDRS